MKRRFDRRPEEAFNEAVELLQAGRPIDALLQEHPEQASELAGLLDTVANVRSKRAVPARSPEVAAASRERFMATARGAAPARKPLGFAVGLAAWWSTLLGSLTGPRRFSYAMAALLVLVLLVGISTTQVLTAAASALPGDTLYQVKRASEQVQLRIARDEATREALGQAMAARRIQEAQAITQLRRPVASLTIDGLLETLAESEWQIAGLKIGITPETRISGEPEVGARVVGQVQAPGDGSLIALTLNIQPTRREATVVVATDTPTPTATTPTTTSTATPMPTFTPSAVIPRAAVLASDTPQPTSTPTPDYTPTSTRTPTRPPTATLTANPSPIPTRPTPQSARKSGTVVQIDGYVWTIQDVDTVIRVLVDASTEWVSHPQLGDRVEATFVIRDGANVATRIEKTGGPDATPEPMDFAGLIQRLDGEWWTVRGISFRVSNATQIDGEPGIDRFAEVHAERRAGEEIWAKRIAVKSLPEYEFTGIIEGVSSNSIIARGVTVSIDNRTKFLGDPPLVGRLADVQAIQFADGRLMARAIYTWPPTPTPTTTPTRRPTRTPTSTPTTTNTPPSPQPQPTDTPTAAPSVTPPPAATSSPTQTATSTVQAAAASTHQP